MPLNAASSWPMRADWLEGTRPHPGPVQRDWGDDQIGMIIRQMPNQLPCDDAGQTNFSAIFQPKHNLRRYIIIFHGRPDAVMPGWMGDT